MVYFESIEMGFGDPSLTLRMTGLFEVLEGDWQRFALRTSANHPPLTMNDMSFRTLVRNPRGSAGNCHITWRAKLKRGFGMTHRIFGWLDNSPKFNLPKKSF